MPSRRRDAGLSFWLPLGITRDDDVMDKLGNRSDVWEWRDYEYFSASSIFGIAGFCEMIRGVIVVVRVKGV